jgi:hypothetical protein
VHQPLSKLFILHPPCPSVKVCQQSLLFENRANLMHSPQQILPSGFRSGAHLAEAASQELAAGGTSDGSVLNVSMPHHLISKGSSSYDTLGDATPVASTSTKAKSSTRARKLSRDKTTWASRYSGSTSNGVFVHTFLHAFQTDFAY